jgi:2-methylcitrate dehydratase PrpD
LPPEAVQAVCNFTLDLIGVGIAGTRSPYAAGVRQAAAKWGSGAEAHVFATGEALPAPHAAFVNAFQAHALEFDCVHEGAVLHPFTVVIPVLLAEAQRTGLAGARFVSAAAVGVDVAAGLGVAAKSQIRFFRPATCGLFGAVAALAHARGLNADQTAHAFGYALAWEFNFRTLFPDFYRHYADLEISSAIKNGIGGNRLVNLKAEMAAMVAAMDVPWKRFLFTALAEPLPMALFFVLGSALWFRWLRKYMVAERHGG